VKRRLDKLGAALLTLALAGTLAVAAPAGAAKAGKKVLCEKPVDLDIKRVDACWKEIGGLKPVVMIGFNRRFDPSFKAVRDRIQSGEIGKVEQIVITSRDPAPPPPAYLKP